MGEARVVAVWRSELVKQMILEVLEIFMADYWSKEECISLSHDRCQFDG
jgi:hypothetical protein